LTSSAATVASVPSFVVVAAGQMSTTFALEGVSRQRDSRPSIDGGARRKATIRAAGVSLTFERSGRRHDQRCRGDDADAADGRSSRGVAGPGVQVRAPTRCPLGYASGSMNCANGHHLAATSCW
jgi:hypothetical protein